MMTLRAPRKACSLYMHRPSKLSEGRHCRAQRQRKLNHLLYAATSGSDASVVRRVHQPVARKSVPLAGVNVRWFRAASRREYYRSTQFEVGEKSHVLILP